MKVLITGINGFAGSHLAEFILENSLGEVHGTVRGRTVNMDNLRGIEGRVKVHECDVTDSYSVGGVMRRTRPELIFHLAARAFVPDSWKSPLETMSTNVSGAINIFEAARKECPDAGIQIACSSEEYGLVKEDELPIKEENPLRPMSPYAVSKCAMDFLGYQYFKSYGLRIVRTRGFNHSGPRRGEQYVDSDWSRQVARMEKGLQEPVMMVGNLEAKRDFTDVRDMVRGYWLALEKGEPGEVYNICSGNAMRMKTVLDMLLGMTEKEISVRQDPERMRPSDVPVLAGDNSKFRRKTGWKPKIDYEKTLGDTLDYWRKRVA